MNTVKCNKNITLVNAGQTQIVRCENEIQKRYKMWEEKISVKQREKRLEQTQP
jgi:hypothetical protein